MMKLYSITGTIKCGHRLYTLHKMIVAPSAKNALEQYLVEHPHAKNISVKYKYDLRHEKNPHIIFTNTTKKS